MFEQDYVMKLIKEMVRAILKLLFNIDTESPTVELLENKEEQETLENLLDMVYHVTTKWNVLHLDPERKQ